MNGSLADRPLPELLAPAGSPEALEAALAAGADAVYLGGSRFNARLNAHNFDAAELARAVTHAHRLGGRVYLTLNTILWDRELPAALEAAYEAASAGVDALIIADLGAAALIRRALPGLPLHASTQLSGHNARMGEVLAPLGFSRFVIARETSLHDLRAAIQNNPLEVEVFIHGALCVSHSGQCLFSSVVGGRSGNRGECAQPCRLPYRCAGCGDRSAFNERGRRGSHNRNGRLDHERRGAEEGTYPLSLKDLSLAAHVPALIEAGVSSLKIEGRMKSAGYVGGVTAIWRRLLDERRAATTEEVAALGELFSRNGFTDGYQVGRIDRRMLGVRAESDKVRSTAAERAALAERHPPRLSANMGFFAAPGEPVRLTATAPLYRQGGIDPRMGRTSANDIVTVTVEGEIPATGENSSETLADAAQKQLSRTGGTPYAVKSVGMGIHTDADGHAPSIPLSRLNALRREALDALDVARMAALPNPAAGYAPISDFAVTVPGRSTTETDRPRRTARFTSPAQITLATAEYFDILYLPLGASFPACVPPERRGVLLPPVIFDHDAEAVTRGLAISLEQGISHRLVGNLGHLSLAQGANICLHGDFRFNVTNAHTAARLLTLGLTDVLLSPELTVPRMRDISRAIPGATGAIVYGRLPLMLLEKCVIREVVRDRSPEAVCREVCAAGRATLTDRMGKVFPILREAAPDGRGHRNVIHNALPLSMSDRPDELARCEAGEHHYLFSTETAATVDRVIEAYRTVHPLGGEVRRMVK